MPGGAIPFHSTADLCVDLPGQYERCPFKVVQRGRRLSQAHLAVQRFALCISWHYLYL